MESPNGWCSITLLPEEDCEKDAEYRSPLKWVVKSAMKTGRENLRERRYYGGTHAAERAFMFFIENEIHDIWADEAL